MNCKNCGKEIQNNWKYCPNCSYEINRDKKIKIVIFIIIVLFVLIFISNIKEIFPVDDIKSMENVLEEKYSKNFDKVEFIESIKNEDVELNCDGSSFGTIKGKGYKEYYRIYSPYDDIYFYAYFDTSKSKKFVADNYEEIISRKKEVTEVYEYIKLKIPNDDIKKIVLRGNSGNSNVTIDSEENLKLLLRNSDEENKRDLYSLPDELDIYINHDIFEYSKLNFEMINDLNDKIIELGEKYKYYSRVILIFKRDAMINLNRLDGESYVYDKLGKAWGERFNDFINRKNY